MDLRRLIRAFSYKSKLGFILLCSYLPVIILLVAVPLLLSKPVQDLECKINAMKKLDESASIYLKELPKVDNAEKQIASLRQDPGYLCAFSLLLRDNDGRRLLQAAEWELPESRKMLAGLISSLSAAPQQQVPSQEISVQISAYRQKLLESVERSVTQLELAFRSNPDLPPTEIQAWREKMVAFEDLIAKADESKPIGELSSQAIPLGMDLLQKTVKLQKELYRQSERLLTDQLHSLKKQLLISVLTLLAGGLIVALFYLSNSIRHPLVTLKTALDHLSKGVRVPLSQASKDERIPIILAFDQLADTMEKFWSDRDRIKKNLSDTFEQVGQTSRQLDDMIEAETATTRQIAKGSRDIFNSIQTFSDELISASHSAVTTGALAATGDEGLHQMETIMQHMLAASSQIVTTLSALQQEIGTVNNVILTIVKIADQSNLLSLNTAIRASKSGAEGRGFAVIADRIREMADQIALVTLDIEKSVQEIVLTVLEAAEGVTLFSEHIRQQVQETGEISIQLKGLIGETQDHVYRFERIKEEMQHQMQQISLITQIISDIKKGATVSHQLAGRLRSEMHLSAEAFRL